MITYLLEDIFSNCKTKVRASNNDIIITEEDFIQMNPPKEHKGSMGIQQSIFFENFVILHNDFTFLVYLLS